MQRTKCCDNQQEKRHGRPWHNKVAVAVAVDVDWARARMRVRAVVAVERALTRAVARAVWWWLRLLWHWQRQRKWH